MLQVCCYFILSQHSRAALFTQSAVQDRLANIAQSAGVLHNDIKPDNVFLRKKGNLDPDNLVLGDLGLANTYEDCWDEAGTPGFMAPEVLLDGVHSPKTDVFSLGVTLYFMVFAQLPFDFDLGMHTTAALLNLLSLDNSHVRATKSSALKLFSQCEVR